MYRAQQCYIFAYLKYNISNRFNVENLYTFLMYAIISAILMIVIIFYLAVLIIDG